MTQQQPAHASLRGTPSSCPPNPQMNAPSLAHLVGKGAQVAENVGADRDVGYGLKPADPGALQHLHRGGCEKEEDGAMQALGRG